MNATSSLTFRRTILNNMKRTIVTLLLFLFAWSTKSQGFHANDNILYGVGVSYNEESADSVAMLSLSRTIRTRVVNESEHVISENNGSSDDRFKKRTALYSTVEILGAKKHVEIDPDGRYVVYRYIDKERYVGERIEQYSHYMEMGNSLNVRVVFDTLKHRKNLLLGCYYRAYEAVSDTTGLFSLLYGRERAEVLAGLAMESLMNAYYNGWEYIYVDEQDGMRTEDGARLVHGYSSILITDKLYAFEYFDGVSWSVPPFLFESAGDYHLNMKSSWSVGEQDYERALIQFSPSRDSRGIFVPLEYRWLFEEKINGVYVKIDVPERFYYLIEGKKMYININIV